MANHAPTRTHIISNQPASPIALAKSTAIGPKAMRYRNGFMRIVISARPPKTSSTSPISAKRPMLGSKKAPSLVGGAKDYKRHSRKPNTCFRSRAIPGARIGSRKKSPAEAGPSVLRKEGYFRSSAAKQFRGAGVGSYSGERSPQESQSVAAEQQMSAASSPFEPAAAGL